MSNSIATGKTKKQRLTRSRSIRQTGRLTEKPSVASVRWRSVLAVLTLTGCLLAGLYWGSGWWAATKAHQLEAQLATASEEELAKIVAQLSLLDRSGVAVLVRSLRSPRPEVIQLSQSKLADLLDSWRAEPSRASSPRVAALAKSLAAEVDALPPASQRFGGNLATEILLWPLDQRRVDATQVVMHCELILRVGFRAENVATNQASPSSATPAESAPRVPRPSDRIPAATASQARPVESPEFSWSDPLLAGGGIPIDPLDVPPTPPQVEEFDLEAPSRFIPRSGVQGLPENSAGTPSMFGPTPAQPVVDSAVQPPEMSPGESPPITWSRLSHIAVFQRLHVSEYDIRNEAFGELQRRGFTTQLIEVGQQATSPRDVDRLELVMSLQKRKDLDPLPWLRHLAEDATPQVSQQALLALSTLADPFEARLARERLKDQQGGDPAQARRE